MCGECGGMKLFILKILCAMMKNTHIDHFCCFNFNQNGMAFFAIQNDTAFLSQNIERVPCPYNIHVPFVRLK